MIFSFDLLRARKGDCFLIHFGTKRRPGLLLIDGGPRNVYRPSLKPRLEAIRTGRGLDAHAPLSVDMMMVSHVDDDHIQGLIELTNEELEARAVPRSTLLAVDRLWHNSFDAVIDDQPTVLTAALRDQFGAASLADGDDLPADKCEAVATATCEDREVVASSLKVLASLEQGFRLRANAQGLGYEINPEFNGGLIVAGTGPSKIQFANDLSLHIVGPSQTEVDALRRKHQIWLKELVEKGKSPEEALAAYVDKSVPNLSSLVVMVESGDKRMLLTGDARGDRILEGLRRAHLLGPEDDAQLFVDILKVPHHGSSNNLAPDFFKRIVARHYVFSGDGEHGNPDRETMEMLFNARAGAPFTIHLTYPIETIDRAREADWNKERAKEIGRKRRNKQRAVRVREEWSPERYGLKAFFSGEKMVEGQEILVVSEYGPHLIDLGDQLSY